MEMKSLKALGLLHKALTIATEQARVECAKRSGGGDVTKLAEEILTSKLPELSQIGWTFLEHLAFSNLGSIL